MFGIGEVAILIIVAVLVFGAKKLPELARSAGKSARILKSEVRAMKGDKGQDKGPGKGPGAEAADRRTVEVTPDDVITRREGGKP
ncbi:twin-arginine translocase TatA/TatE family subunit [Streptomyces sp. NPDC054796]